MTSGAANQVFIDTNVLVHANAARSPFHHAALRALSRLIYAQVELWLSRQILREYLATLTRVQTFSTPHPAADLIADIRFFNAHFRIAEDGPDVTARLLSLVQSIPMGGKQIHDANIVATMQAHGIRRLLTHNGADFARFAGLITVEQL